MGPHVAPRPRFAPLWLRVTLSIDCLHIDKDRCDISLKPLDILLQFLDILLWLKLLRPHHLYSRVQACSNSFRLTFTQYSVQHSNQSEPSIRTIQAHSATKDAAVGAILGFSVLLKGLGTSDLHVTSTHIHKAYFLHLLFVYPVTQIIQAGIAITLWFCQRNVKPQNEHLIWQITAKG